MSIQHGLEIAKQALSAQQSALHTTSNNIANSETKGYSRQRVNFDTLPAYPAGARNRPEMAGQIGSGVEAGTVERIRNQYLDGQFRAENSKTEYWETKADSLSRMEDLLNEPSDHGLSKTMDQFRDSLKELSKEPDSTGARSVVAERGIAVADTFNYLSDSLQSIRKDEKEQIDVTKQDVNNIAEEVQALNEQIKNVEAHGDLANDLYDDRDKLIDELSGIMDIKVSYSKSGDGSMEIADGLATIEAVDRNGESVTLVDGEEGTVQSLSVSYAGGSHDAVEKIKIGKNDKLDFTEMSGSLAGHIDVYGYEDEGGAVGDYPEMLDNLDELANKFAGKFNEQHAKGTDLNGNNQEEIEDFFIDSESAETITVNSKISDNPELIAASGDEKTGDGDNASELADVFGEPLSTDEKATVKSFYESLIGDMGVKAEKANRMEENSDILRSQIDDQRESVSGVSLDEEMSNMVQSQHAYNAAARSMTTMDEMLDQVINNMGLVGR